MARLPIPGSDQGAWGAILNDFLATGHNSDGSIKNGAIGLAQLAGSPSLAAGQTLGWNGTSFTSTSGSVSVTRDDSGVITGVTDGIATIDQVTRSGGKITSFRENGTTRTITRNTNGKITGIS